jgi:vacuolar protein sorting-associated protein 13A/C
MGNPSESVRFLDDVDLTFSLDSRSSASQQMTNMEIAAKPIVFRASYRDINMITAIVNKAIVLYGNSQKSATSAEDDVALAKAVQGRPSLSQGTNFYSSKTGKSSGQPIGRARVLMTKEQVHSRSCLFNFQNTYECCLQLKGSFDGFRLVLIGDMHEQPMLHLKVKPFIIGAKDWSGEVGLPEFIPGCSVTHETSSKQRQPWQLRLVIGT